MSLAPLMGIPGKLKTLITNLATVDTNVDTLVSRLSPTRAGNLDDLDVSVSSRASQTSITTLQNSVDTVDTVVDGIAADVASISPIASVQRGTVEITSDAALVTISSINMAKSFLLFSVEVNDSNVANAEEIAENLYIRGKINTSTQLRFDRWNATRDAFINWEVVEYA